MFPHTLHSGIAQRWSPPAGDLPVCFLALDQGNKSLLVIHKPGKCKWYRRDSRGSFRRTEERHPDCFALQLQNKRADIQGRSQVNIHLQEFRLWWVRMLWFSDCRLGSSSTRARDRLFCRWFCTGKGGAPVLFHGKKKAVAYHIITYHVYCLSSVKNTLENSLRVTGRLQLLMYRCVLRREKRSCYFNFAWFDHLNEKWNPPAVLGTWKMRCPINFPLLIITKSLCLCVCVCACELPADSQGTT